MQRFGQWASCVHRVSKAVIERAVRLVMGALPEGSFADREQVALAIGNEVVKDGAPEMWNRTREGIESLRNLGLVKHAYEAIDRFHLMERLGNALTLTEDDVQKRAAHLEHWAKLLDEDDDAIDCIEGFLLISYRSLPTAKAELLWEHLVYLRNNKDRMRYATFRTRGMPVGSGVTESAAKTVIGYRANRGGQRWLEAGLRGALTLRAVVLSDRYVRFWSHVSRHYTARVEVAA